MSGSPRYRGALGAAVLAAALLASCVEAPATHVFTFTRFAMDTVVEYTVLSSSHDQARKAVEAAHDEIERVEKLLWDEGEGSEIRALNNAVSEMSVSSEVFNFLGRVVRYSELSGGSFDASVKPVLDLYGFGSRNPAPPDEARLSDMLGLVGHHQFDMSATRRISKRSASAAFAVGGVAKGYAVDRAVAVLKNHGITDAVVNAGGDAYCLGSNGNRPWRIGVRHPDDASRLIAVIEIRDAAVATSGDYERFFEFGGRRYHHILDPQTGRPASGTRSATVVASTAEAADAFATAAFVLGSGDAVRLAEDLDQVHVFLVDSALTLSSSKSFPHASN